VTTLLSDENQFIAPAAFVMARGLPTISSESLGVCDECVALRVDPSNLIGKPAAHRPEASRVGKATDYRH